MSGIETRIVDQWARLETYRQRYQIEGRLGQVRRLERALQRRTAKRTLLRRRLDDLEKQAAVTRTEFRAVESEIEGTRAMGNLLIEDIIDTVREEMGEGWSPNPIRGYRVWTIADNLVKGNQVHWQSPTLTSQCLRDIPGEDVPHPVAICGPPACGIYAVKSLDWFPQELGSSQMNDCILGVVGLAGKVVEHTLGYRAATATALAISAVSDGRSLLTSETAIIASLFAAPADTLSLYGSDAEPDPLESRTFLEAAKQKEQLWT